MPSSASPRRLAAALSIVVCLSIPYAAQGQLDEATNRIGWNFAFDATHGNLADTDVAGLDDPTWGDFRQDFWNNDPNIGQTDPASEPDIPNLFDSTGVTTGASLSWSYSAVNSWHMLEPANADTNEKLMYGYQALDPTLKIQEIPYACYALVLYYNQDGVHSASVVTLSEVGDPSPIVMRTVNTGDPDSIQTHFTDYKNGGFRVEDGVGDPIPSNVTVFYDLTTPDLQIEFVWPNDGSVANTGTSALQIVETPGACPIFGDGFESGNLSLWM